MGGFDLVLRTLFGTLGITVLAMNLIKSPFLKWIVALIAFTGLYSSILRHCAPYVFLGINTAKKKQQKE